MIRSGVDIIEIQRLRIAIDRYGDRFLKRIYTDNEISETSLKIASLAARFAAKEAVAKALGTGIGDVHWLDIEILTEDTGAPFLRLHGHGSLVARQLNLTTWTISLSHTDELAVAVAFAM